MVRVSNGPQTASLRNSMLPVPEKPALPSELMAPITQLEVSDFAVPYSSSPHSRYKAHDTLFKSAALPRSSRQSQASYVFGQNSSALRSSPFWQQAVQQQVYQPVLARSAASDTSDKVSKSVVGTGCELGFLGMLGGLAACCCGVAAGLGFVANEVLGLGNKALRTWKNQAREVSHEGERARSAVNRQSADEVVFTLNEEG